MRLSSELAQVNIVSPSIPVYSNVAAKPATDPDEIRELLVRQVASPVLWEQTIVSMAEAEIDVFIEVGPGRTLTGLVRKTLPHATAMNVEDLASLHALKRALAESGHLPSQVAQVAATASPTQPASLRDVAYRTEPEPEFASSSRGAYR